MLDRFLALGQIANITAGCRRMASYIAILRSCWCAYCRAGVYQIHLS
jgi:hypothetical protein